MEKTHDIHVEALIPLISPRELKAELPMSAAANRTVVEARRAVGDILAQRDNAVADGKQSSRGLRAVVR